MIDVSCFDLFSASFLCPDDCQDCPYFLNLNVCGYETKNRDNG